VHETSPPPPATDELVHTSILLTCGELVAAGDGVFAYRGKRPGPDWHGHGSFAKALVVLDHGALRQVVLLKQRWRLRGTNTTRHSRPADDPERMRFCVQLIVLRLWACLISAVGFAHRTEVLSHLSEGAGSDRTVQRWMARARRNALPVQQAVRQSLLAATRVEPRPEEDVFRRGRAPPESLLSRYRNSTESTTTLWRALDMLFVAAKQLPGDLALLLAEARRRWLAPDDIFPL
jgi:hypothetical protein